jgi:hypothetical protein
VQLSRIGRDLFVLLLIGLPVLATALLAGWITLVPIAEHVVYLLVGIGLVVFSFLNAHFELLRRLLKRLGWLGQPPFSLPTDSKFGRVYYGSITSVFALVVGLAWTLLPLMWLMRDLGH